VAVVPPDLPEDLVLSVLDVAGAPALVDRWTERLPQGGRVLVIGAGKAGVLSLAAARRKRPDLSLYAVDRFEQPLQEAERAGLCDGWQALDATDALQVRAAAQAWSHGDGMDAVINMASLPGTEMATVLAVKPRGVCLFFGMATSFTRVALGAEGVGADVDLLIGNGYAEGHAAFALGLVRALPSLRALLARRLGAA
jgi:L-erythro-3,5-diaminohexanoate dehydrogenase